MYATIQALSSKHSFIFLLTVRLGHENFEKEGSKITKMLSIYVKLM